MIGFTMTPSHIDYSKIIDDELIDNLVMGECVIISGFAKQLCPVDRGQLINSIMWATSKKEGMFNTGGEAHSRSTGKKLTVTIKSGKNKGKTKQVSEKVQIGQQGDMRAPVSSRLKWPSDRTTGYVGSGLEYAGAVEGGRRDMPNYPRQPYLRPALDYSEAKRMQRRKRLIDVAIKNAYDPNPNPQTGAKPGPDIPDTFEMPFGVT